MIWIWLIARHSHQWSTGPLDRYFAFLCARCGLSTAAMVRALGHGSGRSHWAAQASAYASADGFAYRAVSAAACPHCAALQPAIHDQFARAAKKAVRRAALRIPVTIALAVLVALLLAIPAIRDLHESVLLGVVATSAALAVAGLVFAILSSHVVTPSTNPAGVWFSHDPRPGMNTWFPAQPGPAPVVAQAPRGPRVLALVTMGLTALTAVIALIMWSETFRKVHVVSAEGTSLTFQVDGGELQTVAQSAAEDAPTATFEVRTSRAHQVTVKGKNGRESTFRLDPRVARHGWVLAPHARENDLCLTSITWYYGTTPKDDGKILNPAGTELLVLPNTFDFMFQQPPSKVETQNGASATRTSLRAFGCSGLGRDVMQPFKTLPPVDVTEP